jgi:predicted permease
MRTILRRFTSLFRRRRLDEALDEEVRAHLDLLAADYERRGMTPYEARLAARRAFGGVEPMKEAYRDRRGLRWLEDLRRDLQHSFRALRRAPVFAVAAVLTVAVGMSAMTGMLLIMNAFMFRPLPVDRPEQLVSISTRDAHATLPHGLSFLDLQDYRAGSDVLSDAIGYMARGGVLNAGDGADRLALQIVTDNYFSMLGVTAAAGRLIQPAEGRGRGDAPVIVLAYDYWQSRFGGDPSVVGRPVRVSGRPFTVIGVASRTFHGTEALFRIDAYVPLWMWDALNEGGSPVLTDRSAHDLFVLARLRPGVSIAQARAALDNRAASLARGYPSTNRGVALLVVPETHARPNPSIGPFFRVGATAMAGLAALLLLIMSANVANLLVARATSRGREVALRSALGAGRGQIARQFLTEGIAVSLLGGLVALPIVVLAVRALREFLARSITMVTVAPDLSLDVRVLAATFGVATVAGFVAGLAPALLAWRADPSGSLKTGRDMAGPSGRFRGALVVAQVALSLVLLVSGGLFVRSLERARQVDLGFEADGLFLATAAPGMQGYDAARRLAFYRAASDRISSLQGVEGVAWISIPPLGLIGDFVEVAPEERPADPDWRPPTTFEASVSDGYLRTARVPLVEGRAFDEGDSADRLRVAIVNETLARQFWPNRSAVGRILTIDDVRTEVVGVVRNGKYMNVSEPPQGMVFRPLAQSPSRFATVAVRTASTSPDPPAAIRQAIRDVDPEVAVYDVKSMSEHLDSGSAFLPFRLGALLAGMFGVLGMLLATIGLYGIVAFYAGRRTHEIGVRMALGARAADVLRDVLAHGARMVLAGSVIGVILASAVAQLLRTLLVGVSPFDPLTYGVVAISLLAVALLASWIPARRATMVDPIVALRSE